MKITLIVAGIATAAALTACSSSGTAGTETDSSAGPPSAHAFKLQKQLLTVADLPTGWAVDHSGDSGGTKPSCVENLQTKTKSLAHAKASFVKGGTAPFLGEQLSYYRTVAAATHSLARGTSILNRCTDVSFTTGDGQKIQGTIGAMSFPRIANASHAWSMTFNARGLTLGFDVVVARKGRELLLIAYGDLGSTDTREVEHFTRTAASKLP